MLVKDAYGKCSKNDTKLAQLFKGKSYWNTTKVKDVDGAPGLSSGIFGGQ